MIISNLNVIKYYLKTVNSKKNKGYGGITWNILYYKSDGQFLKYKIIYISYEI